MKLLAHIVPLAILAMPTAALADDLEVTFCSTWDDVEHSWTFHDVEYGEVPSVTIETDANEGYTIATQLDLTDGFVTMAFLIYEVSMKEGRRDSTRVVSKSRVISSPKIRTVLGEDAYFKSGNETGYIEVSAVYITTNEDEGDEEVEEAVEE